MKPRSIRLFDMLFLLGALLVLASAVLSFGNLEARALIDFEAEGDGARGMAIWMVIASLFIFTLLATIVWACVSVMRIGFLRWLLALVVLYALWQNYETITATGTNIANLVDLAASVVAAAATAVLFRADARAWFRQEPDQRVIP